MDIKILIIEEILNRLKKNKYINNIKFGAFSEVRTNEELPFINFFLKNVKESHSTFRGRAINELDFLLRLVCNKVNGVDNTLYYKENLQYKGPFLLLNEVLNCLDNNINNSLDLSMNNSVYKNDGYTYEVIEENDLVIFNINLYILSNEFTYGDR